MPSPLRAAPLLLLASLSLGAGLAAGDADRDRIERRSASPAMGWVVRESIERVWYTQTRDGKPVPVNAGEVTRIVYRFQVGDGYWSKAIEARDRGRFEDAAELFALLSSTGSREPEIVLGAFFEGEMWEQAGRFDFAARAYARIADGYGPRYELPAPGKPLGKVRDEDLPHRLWLDARTRQGIALGVTKDVVAPTPPPPAAAEGDGAPPPPPPTPPKATTAKAIADDLLERGKRLSQPELETRAAMINAAIFAGQGDREKFNDACKRVVIAPSEPAGIHFNMFRAETLRRLGDAKNAVQVYRTLLPHLGADPAQAARARLGFGLALLETDVQAALAEFIALDALPAGSPDQKCVARYHVGRLLWDEARKLKADPAKAGQAAAMERTVRLVLGAAAEADSRREEKAKAKALLDELGPEAGPDAATAAPAAPPAPAAATPPPAAAAAAPAKKP